VAEWLWVAVLFCTVLYRLKKKLITPEIKFRTVCASSLSMKFWLTCEEKMRFCQRMEAWIYHSYFTSFILVIGIFG